MKRGKIPLLFFIFFTCLSAQIQTRNPTQKEREANDTLNIRRSNNAQGMAWQCIGPEGGVIVSLVHNPQDRNELHALTSASSSQVLKSSDSGRTWIRNSIINNTCYDLAIDPQNPSVMYVLSSHRVLKSDDGGLNWAAYSFPSLSYGSYGKLVVNPQNSSIIYACGYCYYDYNAGKRCLAVLKSTDGGKVWAVKQIDPSFSSAYAYTLAIDPLYPDTLYTGGYSVDGNNMYGKLYKSSNGGDSWIDVSGPLGGSTVHSIIIDPTNSSKVFVGTYWGIYRSSDGGLSWLKNNGTAYAYALAFDCENPNTLFAGDVNRGYKSEDGGVNWTLFSAGLYGRCSGILSLPSPSEIFYSSYAGLFRSNDGGNSWAVSHAGIAALEIPAVVIAPSSPNVLYAEAAGFGFFKSTDYGQSWTKLPDFYRCDAITKILVNPNNADDLFILAGG